MAISSTSRGCSSTSSTETPARAAAVAAAVPAGPAPTTTSGTRRSTGGIAPATDVGSIGIVTARASRADDRARRPPRQERYPPCSGRRDRIERVDLTVAVEGVVASAALTHLRRSVVQGREGLV